MDDHKTETRYFEPCRINIGISDFAFTEPFSGDVPPTREDVLKQNCWLCINMDDCEKKEDPIVKATITYKIEVVE